MKSLTKDSLHQNKNNGKEVVLEFFLFGNKYVKNSRYILVDNIFSYFFFFSIYKY